MAAKPRIVQLRRSKQWIVVCGVKMSAAFATWLEALHYALRIK